MFITGHSGFKGTWLCKVLLELGADVYGYSLLPSPDQILFSLSGVEKDVKNIWGDVRDYEKLQASLTETNPDMVIHMAAQPIVKEGYNDPVGTYSTNVMGTVHLLEASRRCTEVKSIINVTTDKVYLNREDAIPFVETDQLNGYDPYSNSKSCSELVTSAYKNSFWGDRDIAVSTCRAGNVIGGGDFASNRIIPDCYRAVSQKRIIQVRNPFSIRPYQHVLEPLYAYLLLGKLQYENSKYQGEYNIGPRKESIIGTGDLVELFCERWGEDAKWEHMEEINAVHEAGLLYLNCEKAENTLGWKQTWNISECMDKTVEWYKRYYEQENMNRCMSDQVCGFFKEAQL